MLAATIAVILCMAGVLQWSVDRGFLEYINTAEREEISQLVAELEHHYAVNNSWTEIRNNPVILFNMYIETLPEDSKRKHLMKRLAKEKFTSWVINLKSSSSKNKHPRHPMQRIVLFDGDENLVVGFEQQKKPPVTWKLKHDGRTVGTLGLYPPTDFSENHQLLFVKKQRLVILLVCIAATLITIALSLPLAFHLTKPIRHLSQAAHQLISGDYSSRVTVTTKDEIGDLARDFNTLAEKLHKNEAQRKLWVSDIAHELRTPLNTLRGEIEAVQDGIRKPDMETFSNLHQSVMRLSRLVEDLYDLSRSELGILSYVHSRVDLNQLVAGEVAAKRVALDNAGLKIHVDGAMVPVIINGDEQRLHQLISNLLNNSITYTDPGGAVQVTVHSDQSEACLQISDTAPGVPDDDLPKLFNRLFRVEESRNRSLGGAGLGLAICHQIVLAHDGTIVAQHAPTGGLMITVTLPLAEPHYG